MTALEALVQGSPEWHAARVGSLGASVVHEAVARTKTGWSSSRANRMATLVIERLTGQAQNGYVSAAMLEGIDCEPRARAAYQLETMTLVKQIGLVRHPAIQGTHASPDGLVGDTGLVEIKCPQPAAHLDVLEGGGVPGKYITQMMWQMACTGRAFCDFVSFCPAFPEHMQLFVARFARDDAQIAQLESQVQTFLAELESKTAGLIARYGSTPEAAAA